MFALVLALFVLVSVLALIIYQGRQAKLNAIRLPEAEGKRSSESLDASTDGIALLHIGESTVAGVGVSNIEDGLTLNIIRSLQEEDDTFFQWQILGKNGAKASEIEEAGNSIRPPDILVVTFGVNDTTGFTSVSAWNQSLIDCVSRYRTDHSKVFFTAVPPMQKFPLLPFPLNWFLGIRAAILDYSLRRLCQQNHWDYIPLEGKLSAKNMMAADGYHPNENGYALWGSQIAQYVRQNYPELIREPSVLINKKEVFSE